MSKCFKILIVLSLVVPNIYSQQIKGLYESMYGEQIILKDGCFWVKGPEGNSTIRIDNLIADGTYKIVTNDFIELNSNEKYFSSISSDIEIRQSFNDSIKDSLQIHIVTPNYPNFTRGYNFKMDLTVYDGSVLRLFPNIKNRLVRIPYKENKLDSISFTIMNTEPLILENDICYGKMLVNFECAINKKIKTNEIEVIIPNLTIGYFERYYIKGEYARMKGNKLIWRGEEYKKVR